MRVSTTSHTIERAPFSGSEEAPAFKEALCFSSIAPSFPFARLKVFSIEDTSSSILLPENKNKTNIDSLGRYYLKSSFEQRLADACGDEECGERYEEMAAHDAGEVEQRVGYRGAEQNCDEGSFLERAVDQLLHLVDKGHSFELLNLLDFLFGVACQSGCPGHEIRWKLADGCSEPPEEGLDVDASEEVQDTKRGSVGWIASCVIRKLPGQAA
jgi:hypothetical protein